MDAENQTSLEDMLEGAQPQSVEMPAQEAEPTGDKDSAVPPADASQEQPRSDDGPSVPRRALEDERRKRQDLERRLSEMERQYQQPQRQQQPPQQQQQQEIPDPWADPQGYATFVANHAVAKAHQVAAERAELMMVNRELNRSESRARKTHGDELVNQAVEAAQKAGIVGNHIMSDDVYEEIVAWFNDYQVATNPAAYREKIEAEILAKHGIQRAPTASQAQPKQKAPVPRSLASTASARPRDDRGRFSGEPTPLEDLLP